MSKAAQAVEQARKEAETHKPTKAAKAVKKAKVMVAMKPPGPNEAAALLKEEEPHPKKNGRTFVTLDVKAQDVKKMTRPELDALFTKAFITPPSEATPDEFVARALFNYIIYVDAFNRGEGNSRLLTLVDKNAALAQAGRDEMGRDFEKKRGGNGKRKRGAAKEGKEAEASFAYTQHDKDAVETGLDRMLEQIKALHAIEARTQKRPFWIDRWTRWERIVNKEKKKV